MLTGIKRLFGAQDMTVGSPVSCLLLLSIPMLLGNFAQVLYGTVNSIIVGRYLGDAALAAFGASQPIQFLFFVFFMTIGTGVTVMVSQFFGAKDYDKLSYCIGSSFVMITVASLFIMACAPLSGPILKATKIPEEIFYMARSFLFVSFLGCIGTGFFNIVSGILRGMGDSIFPLLVLIGTVILHISLDLLAVVVLDLGIVGSAYATVLAQLASAIACIIKLVRLKGIVKVDRQSLKPKKEMIVQILKVGLPSGISQGIMSLSFVFVQSIINAMGYLVATCTTAVMRVDQFAILPNMAFNTAASTFTGQNIGAGKMDRVKQGAKVIVIMCFIAALIIVAFIVIFGKSMIAMFTETQSVVDMGARMLYIMTLAYIANSFMQSYGGIMRGAGDTMAIMWISISTNVVLRIPLAYLWAHLTKSEVYPAGNPDSLYYSMMIAWVVGAILTYLYYRTGKWRAKVLVRA